MNIEKITELRDSLNEMIESYSIQHLFDRSTDSIEIEEKPFPQIGDKFHTIRCDGGIDIFTYTSCSFSGRCIKAKNFFRTKREAEMSHQRDLIVRHDGGAIDGTGFYFRHFDDGNTVTAYQFKAFPFDPKFKTKRECEDFWTHERKAVIQYFLDKK
tara:strand:+ start:57 stop:524 length:468 start_codon:yes stop_codon:yes gene_type:complete